MARSGLNSDSTVLQPPNLMLSAHDNKCTHYMTPEMDGCVARSVGTGRARLSGFRVGFGGQNPSLGTLRLSGFGLFRALGFSGLFQAFLVYIQHILSFFGSNVIQ